MILEIILGLAAVAVVGFVIAFLVTDHSAHKKALKGEGFYEGRGSVMLPTNLSDRPMLKQFAPKAYAEWKAKHAQDDNEHRRSYSGPSES